MIRALTAATATLAHITLLLLTTSSASAYSFCNRSQCCWALNVNHWNIRNICYGCEGQDVCNPYYYEANRPTNKPTQKPTNKPTNGNMWRSDAWNNVGWNSGGYQTNYCCQTTGACPIDTPAVVHRQWLDRTNRVRLSYCCQKNVNSWQGDSWKGNSWQGDSWQGNGRLLPICVNTDMPTQYPTLSPTKSSSPTRTPSSSPVSSPSVSPSASPVSSPSASPVSSPSESPIASPSESPSTSSMPSQSSQPSSMPSISASPSTSSAPSSMPSQSSQPSSMPSTSASPSASSAPSSMPSQSSQPSLSSSPSQSSQPSSMPSTSASPSASSAPSSIPSSAPTPKPTPNVTIGTNGSNTSRFLYDGKEGGNIVLALFENVRRVLSWFGMVSDDVEEVFIEVQEVVNLFELEGANVTTRMCEVPEQSDNPAVWSYYDRLIEKNRNTASLARHVEEYAPKRRLDDTVEQEGKQEDEEDNGVEDEVGSFIPYRLVFTHKDNLLDCEASLSEPSLHTMTHNIYDTIQAYSEVWGDVEYDFLTDVECRKAIYEVEPELLAYYDGLEGMLKADICRSADLYLNGGYYFDVDILVVHPFVASPFNKFVTVKWAWYENDPQFFQAFMAAAPRNKIIKKSLAIMLELLSGARAKRGGGFLGTQAMQDAWAEAAIEDSSIAAHGKNKAVYLLSEHRIGEKQGRSYIKLPTQTNGRIRGYTDITCNFVVADDDDESVYFFSHILGSGFCGKLLLSGEN